MEKEEEAIKENSNKISKKKLIIGIIVSVIIFIFILVAYEVISYLDSPERIYEREVSEYLQEKYNEEFKIKFVKKRNASKYRTGEIESGSYCTYRIGTDENIKEYIYSFSPKENNKIICYVAYAHNIEEDSYKIYEISGTGRLCGEDESEEDISYYQMVLRYYSQKLEIKDSLERYLGKKYTIDLYSNYKTIKIETNKSLKKEVLENFDNFSNLYNSIKQLLQNKDIWIVIQYIDDREIRIEKDSNIENNSTINNILNKGED